MPRMIARHLPRAPRAATLAVAALAAMMMLAARPAPAQETPPPVLSVAEKAARVADVIDAHILPRFAALAETTAHLADVARAHCTAQDTELRAAYDAAFDAWISASHLRFGPTETDTRAFALAFWPDTRGATPRSIAAMIAAEDPAVQSPAAYAEVSIAARGFYAMEALLFDDKLSTSGNADYRCALIQAMSADSAATSAAILAEWQDSYAEEMMTDGPRYRSRTEAVQVLYKVLNEGLEFTADTRLGRPLGSFERPRPTRAEARRSGRSLRHVMLSVASLEDLALRLAGDDAALGDDLTGAFEHALTVGGDLDDPVFAGVTDPTGRLKIEILQQSVQGARAVVRGSLGPRLGVAAGFNALDGD